MFRTILKFYDYNVPKKTEFYQYLKHQIDTKLLLSFWLIFRLLNAGNDVIGQWTYQ